jgi:hypothetical protein
MTQFNARIKRGSASAPNDSFILPSDFVIARQLWESKNSDCFIKLQPYLKCIYLPFALTNMPDFFLFDDEILAHSITIQQINFTDSDLPIITANAIFDLPTTNNLSQAQIELWEQENEYLDWGVSFEWHLECNDGVSELSTLVNYDELNFHLSSTI